MSAFDKLLTFETAGLVPETETEQLESESRAFDPDRVRILQKYADSDADDFRTAILSMMHDFAGVQRMLDQVGEDWFDALPFSYDIRTALVSDMIDAAKQITNTASIPDSWFTAAGRNRA